MPEIEFKQRINAKRPFPREQELSIAVESDRGRIINSAAIRRLQQKTQVFPLERNAAVRSRLTHSLEVQQVGRFISQQVFSYLGKEQKLEKYGLQGIAAETQSLVEMACLMHDIGNPPFGHFGEKAINDWFSKHIDKFLDVKSEDSALLDKIRLDLQQFEGNAQAIRLIFSLLQLNLTYSQTAAILKYTRPAYLPKPVKGSDKDYLMKKPGYYLSEETQVNGMQQALNMEYGCRHPLSYIMEAADDISYCFADIEDAVEKGILTVESLKDLLLKAYKQQGHDPQAVELHKLSQNERGYTKVSFCQLLDDAWQKYQRATLDQDNRFFVNLRVSLQQVLVLHARYRFTRYIDEIFNGTFNQALLEDESPAHVLTQAFKTVALDKVFSHAEVELQELRGYEIIHGLLDYYRPLLMLSADEFDALINKDWSRIKDLARQSRLYNKLPDKHIQAYKNSIKQYGESEDYLLWERYFRCRLMQDFISGMTDQFAFDEYKSLTLRD